MGIVCSKILSYGVHFTDINVTDVIIILIIHLLLPDNSWIFSILIMSVLYEIPHLVEEQHCRVYQKECQDFRPLQLRNKSRYDRIGTCSVVIKSNSFTERSCICIRSVINCQQLSLHVLHDLHLQTYQLA